MSTRGEDNVHKWGPFDRQRMWVDGVVGGTWFVFIHGGAWRDPTKTHLEGKHLCESIQARFPKKYSGFASLDYRLSSEAPHPAQLLDVSAAINMIKWEFRPDEIVLAGHSCGAMLAAQAYDDVSKMSSPIVKVYGIEGIYDPVALVEEYPSYESFITEEFGEDKKEWEKATPNYKEIPELVLIHSKKDELLSFKQPKLVQEKTDCKLIELPEGEHFEVVEKLDISEYF